MKSVRDLPSIDVSAIDFDAETMSVERAIEAYNDVGFIIVRGLMRKHMQALGAEIADAVSLAQRELPNAKLMRYGWLTESGAIFTDRFGMADVPKGLRQLIVAPVDTKRSPAMRACAEEPRLHAILAPLLDGDVNLIGSGQCMYKEARYGNEAGLHQDAIYPGGEAYRDVVTAFTYLVPTTIERGCIWLVPYSHRLDLLPHHEDGPHMGCIPTDICDFSNAVPLEGNAGDTLLWKYTLIHGSKPNYTDMPRPTIVTRFGRLRPEGEAAERR